MNVEVDRIPAVQLSLADVVFDDRAGQRRWVGIVGLSRHGDDVLVTCSGADQPLRVPAGSLVATRRHATTGPGDETEIKVRMSDWYPGDVDSASAAVMEHSRSTEPTPTASEPYPNVRYEGLYGGDLDHVVDAVGGTPDTETRGRRDEATRRRQTAARPVAEDAADSGEDDEGEAEMLGRLGDGYAGDVRRPSDQRGS